MKNFKFSEVKYFLESKSITIENKILKDVIFFGIGSLNFAKNNELTFFHNDKYVDSLALTKAKSCFIRGKYSHFLPKTCQPIIVKDPYLAFAYTSILFFPKNTSTGIVKNDINIHLETTLG